MLTPGGFWMVPSRFLVDSWKRNKNVLTDVWSFDRAIKNTKRSEPTRVTQEPIRNQSKPARNQSEHFRNPPAWHGYGWFLVDFWLVFIGSLLYLVDSGRFTFYHSLVILIYTKAELESFNRTKEVSYHQLIL